MLVKLPALLCNFIVKKRDNLCMHCTTAYSLLRHANSNCEGKLRSLITAAAEGLIVTDNVARLNVHNCLELLWEDLVIFIRGILKGSYCLWQLFSPNEK